jgi:crotonyl-CoA reductase
MDELAEACLDGAPPARLAELPVPDEYTALHLRIEDVDMFRGVADKDVRKSLRVGSVPMPALAPDECLIAVAASAVNYNTVWSAMFEPLPTFAFLRRYARRGRWEARHDRPFHVVGSDGAGVIVRVGDGVRRWQVGDHVVISPAYVDDQEPASHQDAMLGTDQLAWGFETNFGGLAHYAVVRSTQLIPKPAHLTWEEAASVPLCGGTAYRMLVGSHGARIKQGDVVLIWGATGGLGAYATQLVRNGGGVAVGVVGSEKKAALARTLGCDVVINREQIEGMAGADDPVRVADVGRRLGEVIRRETGEDPHVVFDYVGRATFGLSVFLVRRGGTVVTCGSSTGYQHHFDNRYLWMKLKRIVGSHIANLQEQWECNRLVQSGRIRPMLSAVYDLSDAAEATRLVQRNEHVGKVGVLCLAPRAGLGVTDPATRERLGGDAISPLLAMAGGPVR